MFTRSEGIRGRPWSQAYFDHDPNFRNFPEDFDQPAEDPLKRLSVDITDSLQQLDKFLDDEYATLRDIEITRSISSLDQVIQMYDQSDYDTHINLSGSTGLPPVAPPTPNMPAPAPPKVPNPKKSQPPNDYPSVPRRRESDGLIDDILPRGISSPAHVNRNSNNFTSQPDSLRSRRQQIVSPKNY